MEWREVLEFANQWVKQVEQSLRVILLDEGINLGEIRKETLINRLDNIMNTIYISDKNQMSPHMISLLCMHIFSSSDKCAPKSPIEVYSYSVQSVLRTWASLESNISESILIEFFTDLAAYIHLQPLSDLIDEFDMKKLCYLVLKRLNVSNNHKELQEYTNKIISLLNSNSIIVAEQELQVFTFIHLSFQRYFVVQALIRESSIENIVRRFFTFMNERRFHESLLMALGWISLKWLFNNYNHFCDLLISYPTECVLPLGTLLLFDALKYIHNLPSKEVIFKAFNNLLDHPSKLISQKYLKSSQLPIELIVEWMQLNITNEKRLFKFCRCLLHSECRSYITSTENTLETVSPRLFQQLWSLRNISQTAELLIDQTLHEIMKFYETPDHIFENKLYSYLLSQNICSFNIHPLIFSVILALCGGLHFTCKENIAKVQFSPKTMHRESSMIEPIIEYLVNIKQSHSIKVQTLIEKYENVLQKSLPKDISSEIIDTFIALICLRGVSKPSMYEKFDGYDALPLVLLRFKQILLYLKNLYRYCHSIYTHQCSLVSEIESIINEFFCQPNQSDEQLVRFSFACIAAWKKLGLCCLSDFVNFDIIQKSNISQYLEVQFEYRHYITPQQRNNNILQMTEYTPFDLLVFVPQSLQQLFYRLIISPIDKRESLPLIVLLSECLMRLENIRYYKTNHYCALSLLYPLCKEHKLENYSSVLFWGDRYNSVSQTHRKQFFQQVKNRELLDRFSTDVSKNWELLINQERERIRVAMLDQNEGDLHLFGACLSLARLFQARCRSFKGQHLEGNISIFTTETEEIYSATQNIRGPTLQLIVLNIILRLNKPLIFTDEQINRLNRQIIVLLNDLLLNLPLLSSTYLFIQYYERLQSFPNFFQQLVKIIGEKFNENSIDKQNQEVAYIALRMLNDINLSYYLSKFEKQTTNLSDLLRFNSSTFFHYFSDKSSFDSSDITLLSSMYLIELSADIQILEMYMNKIQQKKISPLEELDQLWKDPLKYKEIMTIEVANWITKYLELSNREYIDGIIERVSSCCIVEETAYEIIHTWRVYRTDKDLKFFAYYAVLFCIEDNSIEILNEMFDTHNYLHLKNVIKNWLELESVTSSFVSNILIPIIQGAYRILMHTSAYIRCKEILDLLLTMEQERILSAVSNRSFLSVVRSCSKNLQPYLIQHLQDFNIKNQFENTIKEQYLITIIKWIILESIDTNNTENMSIEVYECIITFLHDQQIPLVQTMIANGINGILISDRANKGHVFIRDDLKKQLEDIIDKTNIDREDLLAACLLAYGNCLLKFNYLEMNQNVSIEIQNLLEQVSLMSSSEIISARALLCSLFSKNGNVKFQCSSNWIKNNLNLPVQKRYNVLLQLTLYKHPSLSFTVEDEIKNHIKAHSSMLLDKFLNELYDDLCNNDSKNIFSEYKPDYVHIGWTLFISKSDMFLDALQKTSFREQKFKTALCQASKATDDIWCLGFYASFGELTNEFVEILTNVGEKYESKPETLKSHFRKIKSVSGRDVIENLFELFQLKFRSKSKFSI
ncbi:unnamed protein product [Rotaria sp. Silwood1]|nr:unnamed protein product [Rotaria sp. Silwood1]CAF1530221.1 unnamed protein product [Rotaria sp. Silwood1]